MCGVCGGGGTNEACFKVVNFDTHKLIATHHSWDLENRIYSAIVKKHKHHPKKALRASFGCAVGKAIRDAQWCKILQLSTKNRQGHLFHLNWFMQNFTHTSTWTFIHIRHVLQMSTCPSCWNGVMPPCSHDKMASGTCEVAFGVCCWTTCTWVDDE